MKIFISWSKDSSKSIAMALHEWIPAITLKQVKTWCSADPKCMPAGAGLGQKILDAARDCDACLVILTKENLSGWWVNFEAGLFFGQNKNVYAILCGDLTYQDLGRHNHPLSVNGVNYTSIEPDSLVTFLTSLKHQDRDWASLDFKQLVDDRFSPLKSKYDSVFGDSYMKISKLLSSGDGDKEIM